MTEHYTLHSVGGGDYSTAMKTLSDVVRDARTARRMTQEDLAEAIGLSYGYVGQLETGKVARPRATTLRKLAAALQVPLDDLVVATGQLDAYRVDAEAQIVRIAALPTVQERLNAWRGLSPELRGAILKLSQDLLRLGADRLEE